MTTPTYSPGDPKRPGNGRIVALTMALAAILATGGVIAKSGGTVVTPPPPPVDTTHVDSTPVTPNNGTGLSGFAIVADSFSEYANTAALMARITANNPGGTGGANAFYSDGINASLASIDTAVRYNGHATLKLSQPGGVANTPWLAVAFPPTAHIWYRATVRWSPGYTTTGTLTNSANAYKMLSWGWVGSPYDGSGRIEITNTTQYEIYEGQADKKTGATVGGASFIIGPNVTTEWTDGQWYDYVVEVDHSAAPGILRAWKGKDGGPLTFLGQTTESMHDGSIPPPVSNISVGLNFNQVRAPSQNQAIWWGQWEVVDGTQHPNPFGLTAK